MNDFFLNQQNKEYIRKILYQCIDLWLDFKLNNKVLRYKEQEEIKEKFNNNIPLQWNNLETVIQDFYEKIYNNSINFWSSKFLWFPDAGNSIAGIMWWILSLFLNQNLINSSYTSPTATFAEIEVIRWLRSIAWFKNNDLNDITDIWGIATWWGVVSNTIWILLAREYATWWVIQKGLYIKNKCVVFIPEGIWHYSIKSSMWWLWMWEDNIVYIKTNKYFQIDQHDLINKIEFEKKKWNILTAIIAYAWDSRTMSIDDIVWLSNIAKKYNLWLHVDACHWYSLCFSDKLKHKINWIHLADSVTIDPHKVLNIPYNLSYILIKNPEKISLIASSTDLITKEKFSLWKFSPFIWSKPFYSLKLWLFIKNLWKNNIWKLIENRHYLAKDIWKILSNKKDIYILNEITINSIVFVYIPENLKKDLELNIYKVNKINKLINDMIHKRWNFYIHTFLMEDYWRVTWYKWNEKFQVQRIMVWNPMTTLEDINDLYNEINFIIKNLKI